MNIALLDMHKYCYIGYLRFRCSWYASESPDYTRGTNQSYWFRFCQNRGGSVSTESTRSVYIFLSGVWVKVLRLFFYHDPKFVFEIDVKTEENTGVVRPAGFVKIPCHTTLYNKEEIENLMLRLVHVSRYSKPYIGVQRLRREDIATRKIYHYLPFFGNLYRSACMVPGRGLCAALRSIWRLK